MASPVLHRQVTCTPAHPQVCRSEERGREAVERVRRDSGNSDVHLKVTAVLSMDR